MSSSCIAPPRLREDARILHRRDADIDRAEDRALRRLLFASFPFRPVFLLRRYSFQPPAHRWFVRDDCGNFFAHAALHERTIGTTRGEVRIGGVAEVCVARGRRGCGLAKQLLATIDDWLRADGVPFAVLFGRPEIYRSSGYTPITNPLRPRRFPFSRKAMVKVLADEAWPAGLIDLRGPGF